MSDGSLLLLVLLGVILRVLFVGCRKLYHGWRLPTPSITPAQADAFQSQVFREICRRSKGPGWRVSLVDHFADRGWNRADAMLVLAEPLKHQMLKVRGWRFGSYGLTRKGWDEYRKNFMWTRGGEEVHISATSGGFIVANVNSSQAVAQGGRDNSADLRDVSHRQLINALREDARSAEPGEALRAQEYADDLAEAVETENSARADRIIGRINALLGSAQSAFAITRELLPSGT